VKECRLVNANKFTVPAADLVLGLRRLNELEVVLHVLNDLGQDAGVDVLQWNFVLAVRYIYAKKQEKNKRMARPTNEHMASKTGQVVPNQRAAPSTHAT